MTYTKRMNFYIKFLIIIVFFSTSKNLFAQKSNFLIRPNIMLRIDYHNYNSNLFSDNTNSILLLKKESVNNINLFVHRINYYSLFNKYTRRYEFYSSTFPNNFDMKQAPIYQNNYSNIDSFNPYGSQDIFSSIFLGTVNYFLKIKK